MINILCAVSSNSNLLQGLTLLMKLIKFSLTIILVLSFDYINIILYHDALMNDLYYYVL